VWFAEPARGLVGHEQQGGRPVVIVSADAFNDEQLWPMFVVVPLTTRLRNLPLHVTIHPPEGGLRFASDVLIEQVHAADRSRLVHPLGRLLPATMQLIDDRLRILLDLP
jgi:mRNA interferase MazF